MPEIPAPAPTGPAPAPFGTPTPGEDAGVPHGLRWGVKTSFIEYVRRMPDGRGSVGDGALPVGASELFFTYDEAASRREAPVIGSQAGQRCWAFRGDVRFSGHGGMLFVRIARPHLEIDGDAAVLTIEDPYARPDSPRIPLVRGRLALLESPVGAQAELWGADHVTLTAEGAELFNDVYAEGEPFEPFLVQLPPR